MFRAWEIAAVAFFAYAAVVAVALGGLPTVVRRRAVVGAVVGMLLAATSAVLTPDPILHRWLLPPALLLLAYWTSGALFVAPMPRAERMLEGFDRALAIRPLAALMPAWLAELLEFAYAAVYVLIPIALALRVWLSPAGDVDRFWTVILVTDFVCFAALPWVQTRPPRALESGEPWRARFRRVNLRLLGATSIQVNTFPSGHAAEALAATLLVSNLSPGIVLGMLVSALAVSAGAVFGRYHYTADAISGWLVALIVWRWLG